jgi:mRNA interferase RelE/StbE
MHSVEVTPSAARQIKKLPPEVRGQLLGAIAKLADDPRPHGCKKLHGAPDLYRIAVAHDYRVVYQVRDAVMLVVVVKTAHRREVYERLDEIRAILQRHGR